MLRGGMVLRVHLYSHFVVVHSDVYITPYGLSDACRCSTAATEVIDYKIEIHVHLSFLSNLCRNALIVSSAASTKSRTVFQSYSFCVAPPAYFKWSLIR
jgi:hypothetical protein